MLLPEWVPPSHISSAETISQYLISLRGGAPFLSGADCRLLVQWLDDDVPVPAILSALEKVALRRRSKRVKTRLSLNASKNELRKILTKNTTPPKRPNDGHIFSALSQQLRTNLSDFASGIEAQKTLAQELLNINDEQDDKKIANEALSLLATFHQSIWEECSAQHFELLSQAEVEIATMKDIIPSARWNELVEEIARDRLREHFPLCSAEQIWNAIQEKQHEKENSAQ